MSDKPELCEGCDNYWWSGKYRHIDSNGQKIPCKAETHYCRPGIGQLFELHKTSVGKPWYCTRTPQAEQEDDIMPKKNSVLGSAWPGAISVNRDIEVITSEIRFYKDQAGEAILEIGQRLIEAKEKLQHGEWLDWLKDRVEFSEVTAQRLMRLAREYSNPELVSKLGYSKAIVLLALPADEREGFAEDSHDVSGEEKSVIDMTRNELDTAIKERNAAREAQAVAESAEAEAKRREEAAAAALRLAEDKAIEVATIAADAKAEKETLEAELRKLRNKADQPVEPDQTVIDGIRKEAEAAAKKAAEEKLKKKIADADAKKAEADKAVADTQAELERVKQEAEAEKKAAEDRATAAEKKLAVASSETMTIFKTHFESVQSPINSMLGCIKKLEDDTVTRDRLAMALRTLCEKTIAGLPAAEGSADA